MSKAMEEHWKPVKGFDGYEISSLGRVKSSLNKTARTLSLKNSKGDYIRVFLTRYTPERKRVSHLLHRLVYENFIGEIPAGFEVHHIDGNKQNNAVTNLEALKKDAHNSITRKEHPNVVRVMVERNKHRPILQFSLDGTFIAEHENAKEAGAATGVCPRNISQVAGGKECRKQAGGFIWRNKA